MQSACERVLPDVFGDGLKVAQEGVHGGLAVREQKCDGVLARTNWIFAELEAEAHTVPQIRRSVSLKVSQTLHCQLLSSGIHPRNGEDAVCVGAE